MLKLSNSTPVYLFDKQGPGHAYGKNGYTRCFLSLHGARKTTLAAVHVYLRHALCIKCWSQDEMRWP